MKRKPPAPSTGPGPGGMDGDRPYLAAADLLRVFSVGLVAWFHIWQQSWLNPGFSVLGTWVDLQRLVRRGYMMVDLLLLLSGFLLYLPCARRRSRGGAPLPGRTKVLPAASGQDPAQLPAGHGGGDGAAAGLRPCAGQPAPVEGPFDPPHLYLYLFRRHVLMDKPERGAVDPGGGDAVLPALPFGGPAVCPAALEDLGGDDGAGSAVPVGGGPDGRSHPVDQPAALHAGPCMPSGCWRPTSWPPGQAPFGGAGPGRRRPWPACWRWEPSCGPRIPADNRDLQGLQLAWRLPLALAGSGFLYCGAWWPAGLARAVGNPVTRFLAGISYNFYIWHQYLAVKLKQWHIPPYVSELPQQTEGRLWQLRYTWIWAGPGPGFGGAGHGAGGKARRPAAGPGPKKRPPPGRGWR